MLPPVRSELDQHSITRLATTLHKLDEAHRRYRVYAAKTVGIGPTELSALLAISNTPGITPAALARDVILSSGATTSLLDRMEASRHIVRVAHPTDRRSVLIHLAEKGEETIMTLSTAYRHVLRTTGTENTIGEALAQLDSITAAVNAAAHDLDTTPPRAPTHLTARSAPEAVALQASRPFATVPRSPRSDSVVSR